MGLGQRFAASGAEGPEDVVFAESPVIGLLPGSPGQPSFIGLTRQLLAGIALGRFRPISSRLTTTLLAGGSW